MGSICRSRFGEDLNELQINDVDSLIENRVDESQTLEYKKPTEDIQVDCDHLAKTGSGFLNTEGGIIIYGVSEHKEKYHTYASSVKGCVYTKETLENLLKNKIHPWNPEISIRRIPLEGTEGKGIFIIEIPKSETPPHMGNFIYYQRFNYQTQPMNHESILRTFLTSYIRRQNLISTIIEPIYSEISESLDNLQKYKACTNSYYDQIILHDRYLYDYLELSLQEKIETFYEKIKKYNSALFLDSENYQSDFQL